VLFRSQWGYVVSMVALKETIRKLADRQAWIDLGKVVAVDIFNGNNDRFNADGEWVNRGNIMFLSTGPTRVIGLDTYDPTSGTRNLNQTGTFPALRKLVDANERHQFAIACCGSVGQMLQNSLRTVKKETSAPTTITVKFTNGPGGMGTQDVQLQVALMHELFIPFHTEFEQGFKDGSDALKRYLQGKAAQYGYNPGRPGSLPPGVAPPRPRNGPGVIASAPLRPTNTAPQHKVMPPGVLDRMRFLGWI